MDTNTPILYKELSFNLMAICFSVQNELGNNLQEKHYQKAVEQLLKQQGISYKKELYANLVFHEATIGHYFLDFLIEDTIVLELKAKPEIEKDDIRQVYAYLKVSKLPLGILINFRTKKLSYKRIVYNQAIKYSY